MRFSVQHFKMSFSESVLLPVETLMKYKRLGMPDLQLKRADQQRHLEREKTSRTAADIANREVSFSKEDVLNGVQDDKREVVRDIITTYVDRNRHKIDWTGSGELIINGEVHPNTNVLKLFRFLMDDEVTSTEKRTVPRGTFALLEELLNVGVPVHWIKN